MAKTKRLRLFAGPNGSGKSTLFEEIKQNFNIGYFVNSDLIEKQIDSAGFINLDKFGIVSNQAELADFLLLPNAVSLLEKSKNEGHEINIIIKDNVIVDKSRHIHSYEASLITSFIRHKLLNQSLSYSFETVMSHPSKLDEINDAHHKGFKTYLYFICLDDPDLNVSRVQNRVAKGGHPVPTDKILERYKRTLENLLPAIQATDQSYLFDNSGKKMELIAEVKNGLLTILVDEKNLPNWFIENVIKKSAG